MTLTSLVLGRRAATRESTIHSHLDVTQATAIILEGLPDGHSALDALPATSLLKIARIAPGCMHCIGNLVMRVTLNRMLRERPARLFIGVANSEHLTQLHEFLSTAPYDALLTLTEDIVSEAPAA